MAHLFTPESFSKAAALSHHLRKKKSKKIFKIYFPEFKLELPHDLQIRPTILPDLQFTEMQNYLFG